MYKRQADGSLAADILTPVGQTAAAGVGDLVAAHGALVTGDVDDLDNIGILPVAANGQLDTFVDNGPLLIDCLLYTSRCV